MLPSLHVTKLASTTSSLLLVLPVIAQLIRCDDSLHFPAACTMSDHARVDCGWSGIVRSQCEARGCCWNATNVSHSPWCFFDKATALKLRTERACEHEAPISLQCSENETINIHDVFYGRNNGDNSCHYAGDITCFNPNATGIVKGMCKSYSRCTVSPKGSNWNFNSTCDELNAQLVVHYTCLASDPVVNIQSSAHSGITAFKSSHNVFKASIMPVSASDIRLAISSTATATSHMSSIIYMPTSTAIHNCACPDVAALTMEINRKDNIIIGLSIVLMFLAVIAVVWAVLLCRRNGWYILKDSKKRDDDLPMESVSTTPAASQDKSSCQNDTYDGLDLENENPYYGGGT